MSRFLLRSEAIASSRIEGITPSPKQIAFAELGQHEEVRGLSESAQLVANTMTVVRDAATHLQRAEAVTVEHVVGLHRALLPDEPRHHGLRTVQNWIGGSHWHPLDADFVPPTPDAVTSLMTDLTAYLNGAAHSPIVQAALVHAQFETIHPFTDGNGRVGRALIHTALTRRGTTPDVVLPISLVLATLSDTYVDGLTTYRTDAPAGSPDWHAARDRWITIFAQAAIHAADQASAIATELAQTRADWDERFEKHRAATGSQRALRSDSATMKILADLPATPVLTSATVTRIHGVSRARAVRALDELREAGILTTRNAAPGRTAYVADDVLETITWAERRLASTRFDTRTAALHRGAPAAPTPRG